MDQLEISNRAISLVGGTQLVALDDDTVEAEQCNLHYEAARKYCMMKKDWTFASRYHKLEPFTGAPQPSQKGGFAHIYVLPASYMVVRQVASDEDMKLDIEYQMEGEWIFASENPIYVKLSVASESTDELAPESFLNAVSHKLAELIAVGVTADSGRKKELMNEANYLLDEGGAIDGLQGTPRRMKASILINARFRRGGRTPYGLGNYV